MRIISSILLIACLSGCNLPKAEDPYNPQMENMNWIRINQFYNKETDDYDYFVETHFGDLDGVIFLIKKGMDLFRNMNK